MRLEHIAQEARPYPADRLEGCETGLVLFAAAFLGHNDAIHFAEAGLQTTCVDIDGERLEEMAVIYPLTWDFLCDDAWEFAVSARDSGWQWDAVSVDTFTGSAMDQSLESLELWCSLARKLVTATITIDRRWRNPDGWRSSHFQRAGEVYWLVLEPE